MGNFISQLIKFLNIVRNILFCDLELLESNRSIALGVIDNNNISLLCVITLSYSSRVLSEILKLTRKRILHVRSLCLIYLHTYFHNLLWSLYLHPSHSIKTNHVTKERFIMSDLNN